MSKYIDDHVALQHRPVRPWVRQLQILTFPLVFVSVFVIAPGWSVARRFELSLGLGSPGIVVGAIVAAIGAALYGWTILLFARAGGTQVPAAPTRRLVTTGPYAVSRNPMVTSGALMVIGLALVLDSAVFAIGGLVPPMLYLIYIRFVEERELARRFGDEYLAYRRSTPFLVPRPWARYARNTNV